MNKVLLVIEPWSCHYEIFPSVIDSSSKIYDHINIYVQNPKRLRETIDKKVMQSTKRIEIKELNALIKDINKLNAKNIYFDIWSNTTHIHGCQQSFNELKEIYLSVLTKDMQGRLFLVIHNQHDMNFTKCLQHDGPSKKIIPVCLSKDTQYKYIPDGRSTKIFEPYVLKLEKEEMLTENLSNQHGTIKLLIIGMCREGKKFNQLNIFRDLIQNNKVEFSYCGWSPPGSIHSSGLLNAVKNGLIADFACSPMRIEDKIFNKMVGKAHAIIDLKIAKNNSYVSSGNIGASVALRKPLIAHKHNYPSFNCLRFKDYDDIRDMIINKEDLHEKLKFQEFLLQREFALRMAECSKVFE